MGFPADVFFRLVSGYLSVLQALVCSRVRFGYMTEAVEAFCTWGKKQASVKHIIAETEIDNFSSQRVLQRNGFIEYFRDKTIWWKL